MSDKVARDMDHLSAVCHGKILEESRSIHQKLLLPFEPSKSTTCSADLMNLSFVRSNEKKIFNIPLEVNPELMTKIKKDQSCQTDHGFLEDMLKKEGNN